MCGKSLTECDHDLGWQKENEEDMVSSVMDVLESPHNHAMGAVMGNGSSFVLKVFSAFCSTASMRRVLVREVLPRVRASIEMFHERRHSRPILLPSHNHIRLLKAFTVLLKQDRRLVLSVLNSECHATTTNNSAKDGNTDNTNSRNNAACELMSLLPQAAGHGLRLLLHALTIITQPLMYCERKMDILEENWNRYNSGKKQSKSNRQTIATSLLSIGSIPKLYHHLFKESTMIALQVLSIEKKDNATWTVMVSDGEHCMPIHIDKNSTKDKTNTNSHDLVQELEIIRFSSPEEKPQEPQDLSLACNYPPVIPVVRNFESVDKSTVQYGNPIQMDSNVSLLAPYSETKRPIYVWKPLSLCAGDSVVVLETNQTTKSFEPDPLSSLHSTSSPHAILLGLRPPSLRVAKIVQRSRHSTTRKAKQYDVEYSSGDIDKGVVCDRILVYGDEADMQKRTGENNLTSALRDIPSLVVPAPMLSRLVDVLNHETDLKHQHMVIKVMSSLSYIPHNLQYLLNELNLRVEQDTQVALTKLSAYAAAVNECQGDTNYLSEHEKKSRCRVTDAQLYGYVHALSLNATIHGVCSSLETLSNSVSTLAPALTECLERLRRVFPNVERKQSDTAAVSSTGASSSSSSSSSSSVSIGDKRKRGEEHKNSTQQQEEEANGPLLDASVESHALGRFTKLIEAMFKVASNVMSAIHDPETRRECVVCRARAHLKCPCEDQTPYCGPKCQNVHWNEHKLTCSTRTNAATEDTDAHSRKGRKDVTERSPHALNIEDEKDVNDEKGHAVVLPTSTNSSTKSSSTSVASRPLATRRRLRADMLTFIKSNKGIVNAMIGAAPQNVLSPLSSFSLMITDHKCRTLLTFDNKRKYFLETLQRPHERSGASLHEVPVRVRRTHILEDSFHILADLPVNELFGPLNIHFDGEEGVDAGGLTRDWYLQLFRSLLNPMYGLFEFSADGSTYQPATATEVENHSATEKKLNLKYFRFAGRMVAKAIFDGQLVDAHFTRSFYKHMLGIPVTPNDMEAIDPQFYKSLRQILDHSLEDLCLELTFTADQSKFDKIESIELKPNGSKIPVTDDNKEEYVRLLTAHRMTTGIRDQLHHFLKGLHELLPKHLLQLFNENELELLISGLPNIDVLDLKWNTELVGYNKSSQSIMWFWNVLGAMDQQELALFVQYVTGTSKVPVGGFKCLQGMNGPQKFQIHKMHGKSGSPLPQSHTCFNQLDLPIYKSEDELREKLLMAINEGTAGGFTMA